MNMSTIDEIQAKIEVKHKSKGLHILNGTCMLEKFQKEGKMREGFTYIPFNEAMCWGEADETIFSKTFIENRVKLLKAEEKQYREIVLKPLEPLFKENFDVIIIWFGQDMFCQMNMLTVMALLEQIKYKGEVLFCMVCESMGEISSEVHEVALAGSLERYKDIMCRGNLTVQEGLPVAYQAAQLYLEYRNSTSEINQYIISNLDKGKHQLVGELLKTFPHYGLGDIQYEMMIDEMKMQG